tara:strand:+ start:3578 stop:3853 length:276 start_codon:yes stop_codon:yes gene_type:complete
MKITFERKHLVEAFQKYNKEMLENPEEFGEIENTVECAESQADFLIGLIPEETIQEVEADIRTEVVADFIAFCEEEGTPVPDGYYETFFGA